MIVAGILLTAVGDEFVIAHPTDELPDGELLVVVAGPALYLLSLVLLRLRLSGTLGRRHLAGAIACLAIGAIGTFAPALVVAALLFSVLVAVIIVDACTFVHALQPDPPDHWIVNAMPERFPRLKLLWVESGLAWIRS